MWECTDALQGGPCGTSSNFGMGNTHDQNQYPPVVVCAKHYPCRIFTRPSYHCVWAWQHGRAQLGAHSVNVHCVVVHAMDVPGVGVHKT